MIACRIGRWVGTLALAVGLLVAAGCGCTDDVLCPDVSPEPEIQSDLTQMGVQLPGGFPLPPGPGPIKPGAAPGPLMLDVLFLRDEAAAPEVRDAALGLFQEVADRLVGYLAHDAALGRPEDFDVAFGLSRTGDGATDGPAPLQSDAWPFVTVQPILRPGSDVWDGSWPETVWSDAPAATDDVGWRPGSVRVVVGLSDHSLDGLLQVLVDDADVDEALGVDALAGEDAEDVLSRLAPRVGAWLLVLPASPPSTRLTDNDILGRAYYEVTYSISTPPAEITLDPEAEPVPQDDPYDRIFSQDGARQVVALPLFGEELPLPEWPEPLDVLWTSGYSRTDPSTTNALVAELIVQVNWRLLDEAPGGGPNPTTDTGDAEIPLDGFSIGTIRVELPQVDDLTAPPPAFVTLVGVVGTGGAGPILFTDVNRATEGANPPYPGPYDGSNVPVPPGTP